MNILIVFFFLVAMYNYVKIDMFKRENKRYIIAMKFTI